MATTMKTDDFKRWAWQRKTTRPTQPWTCPMDFTQLLRNGAAEAAAFLTAIMVKAANGQTRGTPPRKHTRYHTRFVPGDQFIRRRYINPTPAAIRERIDAESVLRIAGPNPTPERLAAAKAIVEKRL